MRLAKNSRTLIIGVVAALALSTSVSSASASTTVKTGTLGSVYFSSGSSVLTPTAKQTLAGWSANLKKASKVDVIGYVQKSGSAANDLSLSTARAHSVERYLRSIGITATFTTKGARVPATNGSAASARRAEVVITKVTSTPQPKPTVKPTVKPTKKPTPKPTVKPSTSPTSRPSTSPSSSPSSSPSTSPSQSASASPSASASASASPSASPSQSASPSASPVGSVAATIKAKTLNYLIGLTNADACKTVTAQLILQPDLGGNSIRSTAVAGTGEAPTVIQGTNLYYDCNFSVTFANVPSGTYAAALVLTGSQVENLYSSDPSAWYSTGNSVGGILTINLNDSITVTNNNLTTLKLITLDAAT